MPIDSARYGFLSVVEVPRLGHCGGLLVLTAGGRPLEFHCTAPVRANRAQQILYGQTLPEFLACDQIASALLQKLRANPSLLLVDDVNLMNLSQTSVPPIVRAADADDPRCNLEIDGHRFEIQGQSTETAEPLLRLFLQTLPVTEPFGRIHQAINEAHSEAHSEAA